MKSSRLRDLALQKEKENDETLQIQRREEQKMQEQEEKDQQHILLGGHCRVVAKSKPPPSVLGAQVGRGPRLARQAAAWWLLGSWRALVRQLPSIS